MDKLENVIMFERFVHLDLFLQLFDVGRAVS
jgi:hypothetical protein